MVSHRGCRHNGGWFHICPIRCLSVAAVVARRCARDAERAVHQRLKPLALTAILALFLTGSYNLYRILDRGIVDASYHMVFGIKFLLAFHVFAMLFILSTPPSGDPARDARRPRLMLGAVISGLVVFALSAYLRTLHG